MRRRVRMAGALLSFSFWLSGCSSTAQLCTYSLNPDVLCRTCDEDSKRGKLVEYFNLDTNELRLFQLKDNREVEIQHPFGKVDGFLEKVDSNQITFDPQNGTGLLVNGKPFPIITK